MSRFYIDSSALVKLALPEAETEALKAALAEQTLTSSALLAVESRRAVARAGDDDNLSSIEAALRGVALMSLRTRTLEAAAALRPAELRTLDAIHLATALELRGLDGFVCYDYRLADAARVAGLTLVSPGAQL